MHIFECMRTCMRTHMCTHALEHGTRTGDEGAAGSGGGHGSTPPGTARLAPESPAGNKSTFAAVYALLTLEQSGGGVQQPIQHEAQQQDGEHAAPPTEAVLGTLERSSPAAAAVLPDELKTFGKMVQSDQQDTRALIRGNLSVLAYARWLVFVIESSVDATQSQLEGISSEPAAP